MQNSREWYEARALECAKVEVTSWPEAQAWAARGLVYATLANAADRRSHGSITDPPIRHTNEG